ncbi:hypothetical protein DMP12_10015 [Gordonibacter urolithinfaciens]|uniref:NusG-like N-terminal domain-containing protein n=1 Tax=Gordonibacter urolithinfaciens TaxID=1335613 RepID=A0A423UJ75_9ACTN|nr:hypothetical protein DMP12_10015 [Gordonibacter urolithinfaciens]
MHVPEGREQATCEKIRKIVPSDLLADAFVLRKERWFKRAGVWSLNLVQMYHEYFFVATGDVTALDRELSRLSFPARIASESGRGFLPLAFEAQEWFEASMDADHVLRSSMAHIVEGELRVLAGPLMGQERRVRKIDRHRRRCLVDVCDADGGFVEQMPLDVPFKS